MKKILKKVGSILLIIYKSILKVIATCALMILLAVADLVLILLSLLTQNEKYVEHCDGMIRETMSMIWYDNIRASKIITNGADD
jgi:hypothetical protein